MKTHDYVGRDVDLSNGTSMHVRPEALVYAADAVEQLPDLAAQAVGGSDKRAGVLMDVRTQPVAGDAVAAAMRDAGWAVDVVLVPDPAPGKDPVCDEATRDAILPKLAEAILLVPVGGGVMNDLAKLVALESGAEVIVFATAASMNGYASANIAVAVDGVKTVRYGRAVYGVVSSPQVLAEAPWELTASGLGDVLAKSVSSADWRLNHLLLGEAYLPECVELVAEIEPLYFQNPAALPARDPAALAALFDALQLTGVAMTLAGTSAPASGGEHLISHSLDMLASIGRGEHDYHGRQVGVGTAIAAEVYARVLSVESPQPGQPKRAPCPDTWGPLAKKVGRQLADKQGKLADVAEAVTHSDTWDMLREELAPMCRPSRAIRHCLREARAAVSAADIGTTDEQLADVLLHADEIRSRVTCLDLAWLTGVLPEQADDIVHTAVG
ncbi:MAG: iron-containing alcohol dehydrogenase [Planctomycetes bacterium]|jgi:glycerol-1-phosphate dehydrogenase [NAD(P)+]|nr:iron-containing alcohol dehydrogenase [Planctomycetota bacterium]